MNLAPAIGGFIIGLLVGIFVVGGPATAALATEPLIFAIAASSMAFLAGVLLGRRTSPKPKEMKLTGRVFEFPQGTVMVEVALRRLKSILPTKVTQSD
ncbi:MAG: hypothetical protein ACXQTI_01845 [Candidatus Nezhaarchaeales archaeon]|nr:MAG: hypothetical protein DRH17_09055 [Deltaproteobacteria bacterium]